MEAAFLVLIEHFKASHFIHGQLFCRADWVREGSRRFSIIKDTVRICIL